MGLFGGFKAKFTRNSTTKEKPQDVVCLKYHTHSEFDSQDSALPVPANIKKNEVIRRQSKTKTRKALAKSAIFPETDTAHTSLSSPNVPQKSQSMLNLNGNAFESNDTYHEPSDSITISTTLELPSNANSIARADTTYDKSVGNHNGTVAENVAIVTNKHIYSSNNNIKTEKHEKAVLTTFSTHADDSQAAENTQTSNFLYMAKETTQPKKPILKVNREKQKNLDNEQSTLIFMTQHSEQSSFDKNIENGEDDFGAIFARTAPSKIHTNHDKAEDEQVDDNFNLTFVQNKTTDEDDDFYVNLVKHDRTYSYSEYSEDEKSYDGEEQEPHKFTRMGYSSQAASIFFGEDVEPQIVRPRRVVLTEDEDDRRSSGADC